MTPILYLAIKSLYWAKGKTLGRILWCDDAAIKPYFIAAARGAAARLIPIISARFAAGSFHGFPEGMSLLFCVLLKHALEEHGKMM